MSDETETDLDEAEDIRDAEAEAKTRADNRAERAERAERMAREGAQAMAEHHASIKAIDERTLKLRSLRLAKEAAEAETKAAEVQAKVAEKEAKAAAKIASKSAKGAAKKVAPKKAAAKD
ncbi:MULTISPECIES: hypothetical protein [Methylobacterium]|jgi:hypothetical protein|uniref:RNA 3'-terminal phosphate cyclase n=1 Tax=Methylobacterium brachiatum TaxID=269660 RepID=A0AAJ1WTB0_9HYPH|nr:MULTISPECIES: hypothetical protein [Methylobacterium]AYO85678.1 hypothetical protein EBB05_27900 [Methylobacterium brachiatum]EIZ85478.1 hypothetical protein WYO_1845 [Methylobacterium sp. GXF4]KNY23051.1 hypothetical protein AKJ13_09230 [Methylobacterium sp. ARG-1]MCB4802133.1 hypothetical protein [Methylobacterium brachiatum]MDF2600376.1 hypothetical protein [Methylobacterium brachiatum]